MMNFDAFLETPTGTKLIATLHDFTVGRALVPVANVPRKPLDGLRVEGVSRLEQALAAAF